MVNIYIVYEIRLLSYTQGTLITLGDYLFGLLSLTKNVGFDNYFYSGYSIGFDARGSVSLGVILVKTLQCLVLR